MVTTRFRGQTLSIGLTTALPVGDAANATVLLMGADGALFECTAVNGWTGTIEILVQKGGTWRTWDSYQRALASIPVFRSAGTTITLVSGDLILVNAPGCYAIRFKRAAGTSATIVVSTCGPGGLLRIFEPDVAGTDYETVAASQTAQALGGAGATGDLINGILVIPATTSPGNVLLLDNATSITVFAGGASSVSSLVPFFIPLGIRSVSGAWKITTGSNVSCIGVGDFT